MSQTSVNARLAMIQAFANFMDNGSQSATVIFYEGVQPASPAIAADPNSALEPPFRLLQTHATSPR